jgi:hypothetical protein
VATSAKAVAAPVMLVASAHSTLCWNGGFLQEARQQFADSTGHQLQLAKQSAGISRLLLLTVDSLAQASYMVINIKSETEACVRSHLRLR